MTLACMDHHGVHFLGLDSEEALLTALRSEHLVELNMPHLDSFSRAVAAWLPAVTATLLATEKLREAAEIRAATFADPSGKGRALLHSDSYPVIQFEEHLLENDLDVALAGAAQQLRSRAQAATAGVDGFVQKTAAAVDSFVQETEARVKYDFRNILTEARAAVVAGTAAGHKTVQDAKREVNQRVSNLSAAPGNVRKVARFIGGTIL